MDVIEIYITNLKKRLKGTGIRIGSPRRNHGHTQSGMPFSFTTCQISVFADGARVTGLGKLRFDSNGYVCLHGNRKNKIEVPLADPQSIQKIEGAIADRLHSLILGCGQAHKALIGQ